jgi:hypothetical protein
MFFICLLIFPPAVFFISPQIWDGAFLTCVGVVAFVNVIITCFSITMQERNESEIQFADCFIHHYVNDPSLCFVSTVSTCISC